MPGKVNLFPVKLHLHRMDSLTQLVLGAAVGEIALGRKIGNRALVWGAIGGTIPDLDVLSNPFLDDMQSLAFHRGITHSILFSILAPLLFGGLVHRLYESKFHKSRFYKILVSTFNILCLLAITYGVNVLLSQDGYPRWWFLLLTCVLVLFLLMRLYRYYMLKDLEEPSIRFREWYFLFFLTFFTHILLDSFTAYGTQVFQPFSNYRLAFDNIAVVDPVYTVPFLICVIWVSALKRENPLRTYINWTGIGISSLYMLFTLINKAHVDRVFTAALDHRQIEFLRTRTSPTILNNLLWSCVAEDERQYYVGMYSIFDTDPHLHYLNIIPKNDSIHRTLEHHPDYQILWWFSDGYLAAFPSDTATILSDLRFGGMMDTIRSYQDLVFNFRVEEKDGEWVFSENREIPDGNIRDWFARLWRRMKGY